MTAPMNQAVKTPRTFLVLTCCLAGAAVLPAPLPAFSPSVIDLTFSLGREVAAKRRAQARAARLREQRAPLTYVEAGSNQWNRRILCLVVGDKLYMFRHADYLGDRGNVFQLVNQSVEDYPDWHPRGVPNRSYVTLPRAVTVEVGGRWLGARLFVPDEVPHVAWIDLRGRKVGLRTKRVVDLAAVDLPREVVVTRPAEGRVDDGFGGATRHLHPEQVEVVRLGERVDCLFWRYHAAEVPALKGKVVIQGTSRPWEFTLVDETVR